MSAIFAVSPTTGRPKLIGIGITKKLIDNLVSDYYKAQGMYYIIENLDIPNKIYFSPDKVQITKEEFDTYLLLLNT